MSKEKYNLYTVREEFMQIAKENSKRMRNTMDYNEDMRKYLENKGYMDSFIIDNTKQKKRYMEKDIGNIFGFYKKCYVSATSMRESDFYKSYRVYINYICQELEKIYSDYKFAKKNESIYQQVCNYKLDDVVRRIYAYLIEVEEISLMFYQDYINYVVLANELYKEDKELVSMCEAVMKVIYNDSDILFDLRKRTPETIEDLFSVAKVIDTNSRKYDKYFAEGINRRTASIDYNNKPKTYDIEKNLLFRIKDFFAKIGTDKTKDDRLLKYKCKLGNLEREVEREYTKIESKALQKFGSTCKEEYKKYVSNGKLIIDQKYDEKYLKLMQEINKVIEKNAPAEIISTKIYQDKLPLSQCSNIMRNEGFGANNDRNQYDNNHDLTSNKKSYRKKIKEVFKFNKLKNNYTILGS